MTARVPNPESTRPGEPVDTGRREFLRGAALTALTVGGVALGGEPVHTEQPDLSPERMGVLVDLVRCVGCRRCEWACAGANDHPRGTLEECDEQSVLGSRRSLATERYCVVNKQADQDPPLFAKIQCMHCEKPPCVSACLVGALRKDPSGPVTYDPSRCIGCRYCMVACPFERIAYEFDKSFTPRVRKCEFCRHRTSRGQVPACVEICPVEALQYGPRAELLRIARERIEKHPEKYVNHIYGEFEAGGTSWLYVSPVPFEELAQLGLPPLPPESPAERTEHIQHTIFKWFAAPIALAGVLATINFVTRNGKHT